MKTSIAYKTYQIHCTIEGMGETLVFLHGWPTHAKLWETQIASLKKNYRTIAFDWLGFGQSDKPLDHHYSFTHKKEILATVLAEVIDKEEPINIIAHDIGGPPAILWTSENPERVKRLILLNTLFYPFRTPLDKLSHLGFQLPILKNGLMSQLGLRFVMNTMVRNRDSKMQQQIASILEAYKRVPTELKLKTILDPLKEGHKNELLYLMGTYKKLKVKRYLIMAKSDPLCYAHIKKASLANPDIPSYTIAHCGHYIPLEKPDELTEILHKILEEEV